jgi:hypothetical protein
MEMFVPGAVALAQRILGNLHILRIYRVPRVILAGLLIVCAGCGGTGASSATAPPVQPARPQRAAPPSGPSGSVTAADHARACGHPRALKSADADEIMAGRLTIPNFRAVTIDPHRDGRIDWSQDPYRHPSWQTAFLAGGWIGALVKRYLAEPGRPAAYRDRAAALLRGWLRQVPVKRRSPYTLVCAAQIFPGQAWVEGQIPRLVDYFAGHWQGPWNHGLRQDLDLLQIACGYPAGAWGGRPVKWRATAREQLIRAFAPNRLGPAIDREGVVNEQSTGYAKFAYEWWTKADERLAACATALPGWIMQRVARMPMFLAHSTQPDGTIVQLGDTYQEGARPAPGTPFEYAATRGASGSPPRDRIAVYAAGYVFGRSGWGTSRPFGAESFYSLRFGRGRQVHGHHDHMSLTYFARGRNLIVDSGHTGYENGPYRAYLRSPEAHNVLTMPGVRFSAAAPTRLTRRAIGEAGQFFEFTDAAYGGGRRRHRGVYVSQRPDFVLVFDRATGAGRCEQLWHLDPALRVTAVHRTHAIATAPGAHLQIRRLPLPGQRISAASTRVVTGQTHPYQGWVSRAMRSRTPAPVVTMTCGRPGAAILTLIAPTDPRAAVAATVSRRAGGGHLLRARIDGRAVSLHISQDGGITRP